MKTITIRCEGKSALLMNAKTVELLERLRLKEKAPKNAPRPKDPREEAAPKVYKLADGRPCIPIENLFSCLVKAGQSVRLDGKRQISTVTATLLPAFFEIVSTEIALEGPPWEVDMRGGVNPHGQEAVCIVRPRFNVWAFRVDVAFDETEIGEDKIRELFDKAGKQIGLGDFRPQKRGPFGRFHVTHWGACTPTAEAAE